MAASAGILAVKSGAAMGEFEMASRFPFVKSARLGTTGALHTTPRKSPKRPDRSPFSRARNRRGGGDLCRLPLERCCQGAKIEEPGAGHGERTRRGHGY